MNSTSNENDLDRLIDALRARNEQQWSEGPAPPQLPADCPTMLRMNEGILRDNVTDAENKAIKQSVRALKLYETIYDNIWYPTMQQLLNYSLGKLTGDELEDVRYHLEESKCARSLRTILWLLSPTGPNARRKEGGNDTGESLLNNTFCSAKTLTPIPAEAVGFADVHGKFGMETVRFDNKKMSVSHFKKKDDADWVEVESPIHDPNTLILLDFVGADGKSVEKRFVVLGKKADSSVAKLKRNTPIHDAQSVYCLTLDWIDFLPEELQQLKKDCKAMQEDDPDRIEAWRTWATNVDERHEVVEGVQGLSAVIADIRAALPDTDTADDSDDSVGTA